MRYLILLACVVVLGSAWHIASAQYLGVLPTLIQTPAVSVTPPATNTLFAVASWPVTKTGKYRVRAVVVLSPGTATGLGNMTLGYSTSSTALDSRIALRRITTTITGAANTNTYGVQPATIQLTAGQTLYLLASIAYTARGTLAFTNESWLSVEEIP
jgi:hypothetical protein